MPLPRSSDSARTHTHNDRSSTSTSASRSLSTTATNAHIKAEIDATHERLERVAQNFSVEWKKFLVYAMAIKQSATDDGSEPSGSSTSTVDQERKNALENLLLQSQSGLVMLREMTHRRAHKWQEIAQSHGYRALDGDRVITESPPIEKQNQQHTMVTRLIAHNRQKARLSQLLTSRKRFSHHLDSEPQRKQQTPNYHHAAVKILAEATHNQHRLSHAAGIAVDPTSLLVGSNHHSYHHHSLHVIQPKDMETFIRFTHAKLRTSLPFERLFARMKWLCTSHRFHVRKRMLALFHQQKAKNAPVSTLTMIEKIKNLSAASSSSGRVVATPAVALHCPLFVLSSIQLKAELSKLLQRHQLQLASFYSSSTSSASCGNKCAAGLNMVALKVQVDALFDQSMNVTAIALELSSTTTTSSTGSSAEQTALESSGGAQMLLLASLEEMQSFYAQMRVESHWDVHQLDILECSSNHNSISNRREDRHHGLGDGDSSVSSSVSAAPSHKFDDDPLLRNEWELLRLEDKEYIRVRVDALARSHFDRAQVDLRSSSNNSKVIAARPSSSKQVANSEQARLTHDNTKQDEQLLLLLSSSAHENDNDSDDELMHPETISMLYLLRVVACRAKRLRLLRLLNYFHFIVLSRRGSADSPGAGNTSTSTTERQTHEADKKAQRPTPSASPASQWRVEKHQNDFVVVENTRNSTSHRNHRFLPGTSGSACPREDSEGDANGDREFMFPAAKQDLETMERHMLRIASVFVCRQERDSLPSLRETSSSSSATINVMAIDRMQVICEIYDCEFNFLQAKLQLVELLLKNGLELTEDATNETRHERDANSHSSVETPATSHTNTLLSLLQRRPLIDFSHAYFFESYAAETLQLELQTSLQQQFHGHFASCEAAEDGDNEPARWLEWQMIHVGLVTRLHRHQQELIKEAEQRWFCVNTVGELHALRQAIYEQMLINWKLIVSVELSSTPAQCLEQSGVGILSERGWQVVFPPKLVMDCCQNLQQPSKGNNPMQSSSGLHPVESMIQALAVIEWHQEFGRNVYEANLLERIYRFQFDFVGQKDSSDTISQFFFPCNRGGSGGGTGDSSESKFSAIAGPPQAKAELTPISFELLGEKEFATRTTKNSANTSKTVPEWLEVQLASSDLVENLDGTGCTRKLHWKSQFLDFQVHWTRFLAAAVRYQDLIGAEIFEFASCSPFLFLESQDSDLNNHNLKNHHSRHNGGSGATTLNTKAVQGKYADEIAEKMKEEMHQNCYPYWISLEQLKGQLKKRFNGVGGSCAPVSSRQSFVAVETPANLSGNGEELQVNDPDNKSSTFSINAMMQSYAPRFEACAQFMTAEAAVPGYLVRVNRYLKRFRNERALMQTQSPAVLSVCAFTPNRVSEEHDSHKKNTLTRWLTSKLQQLRQDLQNSGSCSNSHSNPKRGGVAGFDAVNPTTLFGDKSGVNNGGSGDENQLLLSLPSHLYLIDQFAVPLCHEQPSPAFSKGFALANDERVVTLRSLSLILEAFHTGMDLIRVKSSFHFGMKHSRSGLSSGFGGAKKHHSLTKRRSPLADGLLERWQTHFHEEIRSFHDRIVDSIAHPSLVNCNIYARNNDSKVKLANKPQFEALQLIQDCLDTRNSELTGFLQCMTLFLLMQTIGNKDFDDGGGGGMENSGLEASASHAQRKSLQRCLLDLSTRLKANAANRGIVQHSEDSEDIVGVCISPVVSSASEALQLFFQASAAGSVTQSDREVCAFWKELGNLHHDTTYLTCLANWLDLQMVFIAEYMRPALSLPTSVYDGSSVLNAAPLELEVSATAALDKLWERYELTVPEHECSDVEHQVAATSEVEQDQHTQLPLAHLRDERSQVTRPRPRMHRQGSFAQRRDFMLRNNLATSGPASMLLPSQPKLRHQLEFLRLHFELQWLQADIMTMEHHYESFLGQKKRSQQQGRNANGLGNHQNHHRRKNEMLSPTLLSFSKFYRSGDDDDGNVDGSKQLTGEKRKMTHHCGEFVIPASEMNILLQDLAAECTQHHLKQAEVYGHTIQNLQCQLAGTHHSLEESQHKSKRDNRQEAIKRESYAIDHAYQLHFQMALLKKEVEAMENRMDLERLSLRCQLSDE